MNNKLFLLLPFGLAILGCTTTGGGGDYPQPMACQEPPDMTGPCNGDPDDPQVNLNLTGTLSANPPNVCAHPGSTIKINLSPPPAQTGTVAVVAKNVAHTWLNATNSTDPKEILIEVPGWVSPSSGANYDYGFRTSEGKCVDPRVTIIRR